MPARAGGLTLAFVVASLLANVAVALAVIGGLAGISSAVIVIIRVRDLTAQTAPLQKSIDELTGRVGDVEKTLRGDP